MTTRVEVAFDVDTDDTKAAEEMIARLIEQASRHDHSGRWAAYYPQAERFNWPQFIKQEHA